MLGIIYLQTYVQASQLIEIISKWKLNKTINVTVICIQTLVAEM